MKKALGIDIGGTKILYGIVNEQGEVVSEIQKTATPKTADEIYSTLEKIIDENYDNIDVVGLSSAGAVNIENTRVLSSTPNLPDGYNQIDFSTLCDKKVYVENDANCACAAEYKNGAAKGFRTVLMITIGTGIGGGVISDGKLFRGSRGNALEVGSMKIFADKRQKTLAIQPGRDTPEELRFHDQPCPFQRTCDGRLWRRAEKPVDRRRFCQWQNIYPYSGEGF